MSIRPIDLQLNVHSTTEVNRINSYDSQKSEMFKQQFQKNLDENNVELKQSVVESDKTDGQMVDKDGKNGGKYGRNKDKKKDGKEEKKVNKISTSMFDVSV